MSVNGYTYKTSVQEKIRTNPAYHFESSQFSAFDLPAIIGNLKKEQDWEKGELNFVILIKSPTIKVLLTVLHEGTEVVSYQANDSAIFQVIEGALILHIRGEAIILGQGEVLTLDEKIKYSFDSIEETAFLLTLVSEKEGAK
jgi:quercetin dioxygenase-like cupin family protein